jgi:hypothetical protein
VPLAHVTQVLEALVVQVAQLVVVTKPPLRVQLRVEIAQAANQLRPVAVLHPVDELLRFLVVVLLQNGLRVHLVEPILAVLVPVHPLPARG